MNQLKYERIDKGIKRGSKPKGQPRNVEGKFLPVCSDERRQEIIDYALDGLTRGETTDAIGYKYGIDGSTLRRWLLADDVADNARKAYFDAELNGVREEIRKSHDPFTLARTREDFKAISWIAAHRCKDYADKQEVKHTGQVGPLINIQLSGVSPEPVVIQAESPMKSVTPPDPAVT